MMYIRYPLSLRQVEDILFERGIDICHETVRYTGTAHTPSLRTRETLRKAARVPPMHYRDNPQQRLRHHIKWTGFTPPNWTDFAPPLTPGRLV